MAAYANLLLVQEQYKEAISYYERAWSVDARDSVGQALFALMSEHQPEKAISFLNDWLGTLPGSSTALNHKATILLKEGRYSEAIPHMEALLELNPESVMHLNNLAWVYQETQSPKALETATKAYELAPGNPNVLDTYGWILYKTGDRSGALEVLAKATELAPDNEAIAKHYNQAKQGS